MCSVISSYSVSGQRRPRSDCADAQANLGLRCPHMPENTFSDGAAHILVGAQHFLQDCISTQRRLRSACAHAQSDRGFAVHPIYVAKDRRLILDLAGRTSSLLENAVLRLILQVLWDH